MTVSIEFEKVEALATDFQYINGETDLPILDVGFIASFFFWGGHTTKKQLALADCFDAYKNHYGSYLTWGCHPDTWKTVKFSRRSLPPFREYIKPLEGDDAIQWYEASGDREAVGDYAVSCMTERNWQEDHLSCFQFQVPRRHIFDSNEKVKLESLLTFCIERLTPFHGIAGLAATITEQNYEWQPQEIDVATRYRSLYIGSFVSDLSKADQGIKSVNWFTYVSDTLIERVGGPNSFSIYCQRFGVEAQRTTNGFVILTGEFPELGPIDEPPSQGYVRANAALRPLRTANFGSMGNGSFYEELRFDRCTTDLWIRRFDGPGIWPPASFAGLPQGPVGAKPTKKVRIGTGEPCVVHGRYRKYPLEPAHPDDGDDHIRGPMIVLLPGDLAPFHVVLGPHGEFLRREATTWELVAEL